MPHAACRLAPCTCKTQTQHRPSTLLSSSSIVLRCVCATPMQSPATRKITQAGASTTRGGILWLWLWLYLQTPKPPRIAQPETCHVTLVCVIAFCVLCAYNGDFAFSISLVRSRLRKQIRATGHHARGNGHGHVRVYARSRHIKRAMHHASYLNLGLG